LEKRYGGGLMGEISKKHLFSLTTGWVHKPATSPLLPERWELVNAITKHIAAVAFPDTCRWHTYNNKGSEGERGTGEGFSIKAAKRVAALSAQSQGFI